MTTSTEALPAPTATAHLLGRLDRSRRLVEHSATLRLAEQRLMWLLSDHRPRTLREVAEDLCLEQSTVNRQVNAALTAGLLERHHEEGRAAAVVSPTPAGLERFESDRALGEGLYAQALAVLDEDEQARFLGLLDRFTTAYADAVAGHPGVDADPT